MLLEHIKEDNNYTLTENGGITHKTTQSALFDMFALGGAMRERSNADIANMFRDAYIENPEYALKLLFYFRDIRGGQGERKIFRTIIRYMAQSCDPILRNDIWRNIPYIPVFGRWDDLYALVDTPVEARAFEIIRDQLLIDLGSKTPSLLAKWLKSENTSSKESRRLANITREYLELSHKEYRKMLSILREKINIIETLMSQGNWDKIEFDKLPSRAGFIYRNAFARNDITKEKYLQFITDKKTKVNAGTLYPYEVVEQALRVNRDAWSWDKADIDKAQREAVNKYWDNLTDYFNGCSLDALCMIDTSGSMTGRPIDVAISLGMYCAERNKGPWHNHYISFSHHPQLIEIKGQDFVEKVNRIYETNLCENTNIEAAFDMIFNTAIKHHLTADDIPKNIIIISDMEFDYAATNTPWTWNRRANDTWSVTTDTVETVMEGIRRKWEKYGLRLPNIIYWNVDARQNNIPDLGDKTVSFVSGFSPVIFKQIMTGKTGYDLMMEVLNNPAYTCITSCQF